MTDNARNRKVNNLLHTEMILLVTVVCAGIATFIVSLFDDDVVTTLELRITQAVALTNLVFLIIFYTVRHKRRILEKQQDSEPKG